MSFNPLDDMEKLNNILKWDGMKKAGFSVDGADKWTRDELCFLSDEKWELFCKNLENCKKDGKERNAENDVPALIEASRKVAVFRDTWYYEVNGIYQTSSDAKRAVVYEAFGTTTKLQRFDDFIRFDKRSQKQTIRTLATRFIAVGNRYFDVIDGVMVDEPTTEEFRTYKIIDIDYKPVALNDCKSKLVTDLIKHVGKENVRYILLTVAYNLIGLHIADRRALILVGETRTGKGTMNELFRRIGVAPLTELTSDFRHGNEFCDAYAKVSSLYPVLPIDECETLNMEKIKKICSDPTMQVNLKGEPAITVINRGVPIITTNRVPTTTLTGIHDKVTIIRTTGVQFIKDNFYFEKLQKSDYDEFVSLILTMAHKLTLPDVEWTTATMCEEMQALNDEFLEMNFPHDAFFMHWDKNADAWTRTEDAYRAYLMWCNPDVALEVVENEVAVSKIKPKNNPDGLIGVSRQNFTSDAKCRLPMRKIKGYPSIQGKPPVKSMGDDIEIVDFA